MPEPETMPNPNTDTILEAVRTVLLEAMDQDDITVIQSLIHVALHILQTDA